MKLSLTKIFFILMFTINSTATFAQTKTATAKISGSLTDVQNKAVSYATVSLLSAEDSSLIKGTLTNDAGNYSFDHVAPGNYLYQNY